MDIGDFAVGDKVVVEDGDQQLNGTVESIQVKANLVDVKIYEPGHRSHCLIKPFPPKAVTVVDEHESHSGSYAELQKRVEGSDSSLSKMEICDFLEGIVKDAESQMKSIGDSIAALTARVEALESKKKDEPSPEESAPGDSAASA